MLPFLTQVERGCFCRWSWLASFQIRAASAEWHGGIITCWEALVMVEPGSTPIKWLLPMYYLYSMLLRTGFRDNPSGTFTLCLGSFADRVCTQHVLSGLVMAPVKIERFLQKWNFVIAVCCHALSCWFYVRQGCSLNRESRLRIWLLAKHV